MVLILYISKYIKCVKLLQYFNVLMFIFLLIVQVSSSSHFILVKLHLSHVPFISVAIHHLSHFIHISCIKACHILSHTMFKP